MLTLLLMLFCAYQIFNIQNIYSRTCLATMLIVLVVSLFLYLIMYFISGRNERYTIGKWLLRDFKRGWAFHIIQGVLIILLLNQFIYSGWKDLDTKAKESYMFFNNENVEEFLSYNSVFVPKCFKQSTIVLNEIQRIFLIQDENERYLAYVEKEAEYNQTLEEVRSGVKYFGNCFMIMCITLLMRRLWISCGGIIKDIKYIRKRRMKQAE